MSVRIKNYSFFEEMNKILRGGLRDNVTFWLLSENGGHVSTADVWEREYHNIIFIFMIILYKS